MAALEAAEATLDAPETIAAVAIVYSEPAKLVTVANAPVASVIASPPAEVMTVAATPPIAKEDELIRLTVMGTGDLQVTFVAIAPAPEVMSLSTEGAPEVTSLKTEAAPEVATENTDPASDVRELKMSPTMGRRSTVTECLGYQMTYDLGAFLQQ